MLFQRILRNLSRSLQWKLVFIFIAITLFLMIFVNVFLNNRVNSFYYTSFVDTINDGFKNWTTVSENPKASEIEYDFKEKKNHVYNFLISDTLSVTVVDKKTKAIVYSSDRDYLDNRKASGEDTTQFLNFVLSSENFIEVQEGAQTGALNKKLNHYNERDYFDYAREKGAFILYFVYDREAWKQIIDSFNSMIFNITLMAIIISLVIGYIISKTITAPIVSIMYKAQRLAEGDFDYMLEVRSEDEIGKLTKTFNYMAQELKKTLVEVSSEKNKIETILNYMTDGVVAFNLKGEVIHANPTSIKLLDFPQEGLSFNAFCNRYGLGMSLEDIVYLGSSVNTEKDIAVGEKSLRAYFAVFTDEEKKAEGIVAVFQDITEQQKLDRMRREFVANVSHELRTPLTSIKSYTETLLDGVLDDRETSERFLNVINSESDRMTRLVRDLLQLSRLDNQQMQWNMQGVSLVPLVKDCIDKIQIEAKNKEQQLESFVIGEIPDISADRDRIEQVVLNIVSNSIKYTPSGGKITVYIGRLYSEVYIKVSDTGMGIPESDLPRIFERFYRVDKARSREMGGTGLGLAIAKEIVEAHKGNISIISELGKGTEITVKLPI
jgi:two-component system, OmpR family, sensor histidine kinase VicK